MRRPRLLLAALGGGIVLLVAAGLSVAAPGEFGALSLEQAWRYVACTSLAGALYAGAVVLARRPVRHGLVIVLVCAAAMRALTFAAPPLLSTDIYRYVWDGRVQAAGINPYLHVPADPALEALRDHGEGAAAVYPNINRAEFAPTIYPPAAQALFALVGLTWSSVWGMKFAMLGFDALAIGAALLLLRAARRPAVAVLIYAWNPLPVWEFAGAGHIDAAAVAFSGLAILAAVWRRPALAGAALSVGVLCKLLPAALFPALWRRWDWRTPLAAGAVIVAFYAWYAGAGWRVLGYLPGYADEEGLAGRGAFLLRVLATVGPVPGWAGTAYAAAAAVTLLLLAAWVALRAPFPAGPADRAMVVCRDALLLGTATMVLLSPHYPWYLAGLALPAVLVPASSVLWLTLAAPVLYLDRKHDQVVWSAIVFVPFAVLLVRDLRRRRAHPHPALAATGG